ncbi:MAG TPA: ADOP family duplicated permease [Gemmatimonadaceae bacterium]|jgi:predicted permease
MSDLRYAVRRLRLAPALSVTIVVTLALGIGANAAVFSLADKLFLEPPPAVSHPENLRRIYTRSNWSVGEVTEIHDEIGYPQFTAIASALNGRAQVTAYTKPDSIVVGDEQSRTTARGAYVDTAFFRALGVHIARGRSFAADEGSFANPGMVAVISHSYWQNHFGGDPKIIGMKALFDRRWYTIIGVTQSGFRGPDLNRTDVWLPLASPFGDPTRPWYQSWRNGRRVRVIARVAPGTTDAQLAAISTVAFRNGEFEHVQLHPDTATVIPGPILESLGPSIGQRTEVAIMLRLIGVALALLLVACANVANLLLATAVKRQREIGVRLALGVTHARLLSQLLVESLTLSLLAGAASVLVGVWCSALLARLILPDVTLPIGLDGRTVAFTVTIAVVTGVLAGLAPALQARRTDVTTALRGSARLPRSSTARLRELLVVAQTALSLMLVVGAGLFARSLSDLKSIDVGYDVDRLVWGTVFFYDAQRHSVDRDGESHAAELRAGLENAVTRLQHVPGVERVALSTSAPMAGYAMVRLFTDTGAVPRLDNRDPALMSTTPEYFATTGIELRRGRFFNDADDLGAPPVVIVNETAAKAYWPNRDAVGQCLHLPTRDAPCLRVIGVAKDSHLMKVLEEPTAQLFVPVAQRRAGYLSRASFLVVRARPGDVARVADAMRLTLYTTFPTAEPPYVRTTASLLEPQLRPWTLGAMLFAAFAVLASIVAGVGVYSAVAYAVSERTRELGIRVALGAASHGLVALVVGTGVRVVVVGILVGIALVLLTGRLVAAMLYATSPHDPLVMMVASVALVVIAVLASALPAWRASRTDPMIALRAE